MNLDERAGKFKDVKWNHNHTSFIAVCPGSNGKPHNIACGPKTSCLGYPKCSDELIGKFFANGTAKLTEVRGPAEAPRSPAMASGVPPDASVNGNGAHFSTSDEEPKQQPEAESDTEASRQFILSVWKRLLAKLARDLLHEDKEYQKAHLTAEDLFDPLLRDLRLAVQKMPDYQSPTFLNETEVDEHLQAVVVWATDWFLKARKAKAAEDYEREDEPEPPLKALNLGELYSLVDEWEKQPWVWEGILPRSSLSLIVGKSETGKSTLIYALIYAIVRGLQFFGRRCEQGRVLYLAGDPVAEIVAGKTFRAMGLRSDDGIKVVAGALVSQKNGMQQLRQWVRDFRPALVVGDTLAATVAIDVDKYGQSYQVQQPLSRIAREFSPNFLMAHHSQKSAIDSYSVIDAALGSVGVAAVASSRMATRMYQKAGKKFYTFAMSNLRIGQPLEGEYIVVKKDNGEMELNGLWSSRATALDQEAIIKALERQSEPVAERTLWGAIYPKPKWQSFKPAFEGLIESGRIVVEPRKGKGGGKLYSLKCQPSSSY